MNCNHAPASTLSVVAGRNSWRVINSRLTLRGLGLSSAQSLSGYVSSTGTFRPKRVSELPITGLSRSLKGPSAVRPVRCRPLPGGEAFTGDAKDVS